MFNFGEKKYSTNNLYIVEIREIINVEFISIGRYRTYYSDTARYAIANKKEFYNNKYIDIFTGTEYKDEDLYTGKYSVRRAHPVITDRKFITKEEAILLLQELNPTYLSPVKDKEKVLSKSRKSHE